MGSEWPVEPLGTHCVKIGSGATPRGGKATYVNAGSFSLIRSQNVYNDGFHTSGLAFISDDQARALSNVSVEQSDILLNITGDSVARVCLAPPDILPARVNQHVAIIRPKKNSFDARYLRYFLVSATQQERLLSLAAIGATRNAITKGMIESLEVPVPPLVFQRRCADILSALDDRIDNLRATNATLEAIAQALFKSWFVDFDPVRAKAEGREPEGMDAATAALFPSEFEKSVVGLIPKGWPIRAVGDVATIVRGRSYKSSELADSDTALVTLKSFNRGGGFRRDGFKSYTGPFKAEQEVFEGDCIVAHTDVTQQAELIGRSALVTRSPPHSRLVASLDVGIVRSKSHDFTSIFLSGVLSGDRYVSHIKGYTSGTTVLHLSKDGLPSFKFACPPPCLARIYSELALAMFRRQATNVATQEYLAEVRDTLLPRLISGKLRLPEAAAALDA
ncbi:MAG: restriction endonuclease subunit S [Proteobacteria bacterium]|nr:restriction endonuclease subunit S [Pseudomonadota bacterium]